MRLVFLLRRLSHQRDALLPELSSVISTGAALQNRFLSRSLASVELGQWTLCAAALDYLEEQVKRLKPRVILELGSGVSTVCLARYLQEVHGDSNSARLFSIEQNADFSEETRQKLSSLGLDRNVRLIHAPLTRQVILGQSTTCYSLPPGYLVEALGGARPEFVLIDGPASDQGRYGVLPLLRPVLSRRTAILLDDALRDDELRDAAVWSKLPYVRIKGYWLGGKGFLCGDVVGG